MFLLDCFGTFLLIACCICLRFGCVCTVFLLLGCSRAGSVGARHCAGVYVSGDIAVDVGSADIAVDVGSADIVVDVGSADIVVDVGSADIVAGVGSADSVVDAGSAVSVADADSVGA